MTDLSNALLPWLTWTLFVFLLGLVAGFGLARALKP